MAANFSFFGNSVRGKDPDTPKC